MNLPKILVAILALSMAFVGVQAAPNGGFNRCPQEWCSPMYQGQNYQIVKNSVNHVVNVYGVASGPDCGISVDGILVWVPEGQNQTINGTNVKIRQVMAPGLTTSNPFYLGTNGCYVCVS